MVAQGGVVMCLVIGSCVAMWSVPDCACKQNAGAKCEGLLARDLQYPVPGAEAKRHQH